MDELDPQPLPPLLTLPTELIQIVADYLSIPNVNALVQACRQTCAMLNRYLYRQKQAELPRTRVSALLYAGRENNLGTLRKVIQYSGPEYVSGDEGRKALVHAADNKHEHLVRVLLEHGGRGLLDDFPYWSLALPWSFHDKCFGIVEALLDAGADVAQMPREMETFDRDPEKLRKLLRRGVSMAPTKDHRNLLPDAAWHGNVDILEQLLDNGANVDDVEEHGVTPLVAAIKSGHVDAVRFLLSRGANPNHANNRGSTAMHALAMRYDARIYNALVQSGADINATDRDGLSPLLLATGASDTSPEIVRRLVEDGARDLTMQGSRPLRYAMQRRAYAKETVQILLNADVLKMEAYQTPFALYCAVHGNYVEIVQRLLDLGLSPTTPTHFRGITPLMAAMTDKHEEVFHMLLPHVTDFEAKCHTGLTALAYALLEGGKETIRLLMERTLDVDKPDSVGNTPLILAATQQDTEVVSWVAQRCSNINHVGAFSRTALYHATGRNEEETMKLLLEKGAVMNCHDIDGVTPLVLAVWYKYVGAAKILLDWAGDEAPMFDLERFTALVWAVDSQQVPMVELLLKRGVDPNMGKSQLMVALEKGNEKLAHLLLDHGARVDTGINDQTPLIEAVRRGLESVVARLLAKSPDIDFRNEDGTKLLSCAATAGNPNIVRTLFDRNANLHARDNQGGTPLSYACYAGHVEIVRLLLERGAEVNYTDEHGQTPLFVAAKMDDEQIIESLLRSSANVNYSDRLKRTALSYAAELGNMRSTQVLLRHGANVHLGDNDGRTPLSWAVQRGRIEVARALVNAGSHITSSADANGKTPLSWALEVNDEDMIKVLYDALYL